MACSVSILHGMFVVYHMIMLIHRMHENIVVAIIAHTRMLIRGSYRRRTMLGAMQQCVIQADIIRAAQDTRRVPLNIALYTILIQVPPVLCLDAPTPHSRHAGAGIHTAGSYSAC